MSEEHKYLKQENSAGEEQNGNVSQNKKGGHIIIKVPPQTTALKEAAQKGDPYCEVIEKNDTETE